MASQDSSCGKVQTLEWSVFSECFERVLRACGSETAAWLLEWGYADLIESDQNYKRENGDLLQDRHKFILPVHDLKSWLLSLC